MKSVSPTKKLIALAVSALALPVSLSFADEPVASGENVHKVKVALFVRLEAKPGKEVEVERFLKGGLPIVQQEPATTAWFGIRLGPTTFGIFDAFPDENGRKAHLNGKVAAALKEKAELFAQPPVIEKVDVLAAKLPYGSSKN
jgi:quinol monooxygenase YgiN